MTLVTAVVTGLVALPGCTRQDPTLEPPSAAAESPPAAGSTGASSPAPSVDEPGPDLPAGALRELVPAPSEVPAPLVPLLQASGPRDAAAVASFSTDPAAAEQALTDRRFTAAYVAQYAAPGDPRTLTCVVARFATAEGAQADHEDDVSASDGEVLDVPIVGEASQGRRVPLPDEGLDLVTVRFRVGSATWLLAWQAPEPADPAVPVALARVLAARG